MRVFLAEVRKTLWLRNLLIAGTLGALYYWAFVWTIVELTPNGNPETEMHQYAISWHQQFGPSLDTGEIAAIEVEANDLVRQADSMIAADPTLAAAGIRSWAQLAATEVDNPDVERAQWALLFGDGGLGWRIQAIQISLEAYGPLSADPLAGRAEISRIEQINSRAEWRHVQSPAVVVNFLGQYPGRLATLVFLVVLLITSPLLTSDRVSRLPPLQASSSTGRPLMWRQLAAVLTVAALTTAAVLGLTSLALGELALGLFWDTPIQSFNTPGAVYPPITLGETCLLLGVLIGLCGVLAGLVGFAWSYASRTYQGLALTVVATLAAAFWAIPQITDFAFRYQSPLAALTGNPWAPLWVWTGLVGLGLTLDLLLVRHAQASDVEP